MDTHSNEKVLWVPRGGTRPTTLQAGCPHPACWAVSR